jgi:hypothetical protein
VRALIAFPRKDLANRHNELIDGGQVHSLKRVRKGDRCVRCGDKKDRCVELAEGTAGDVRDNGVAGALCPRRFTGDERFVFRTASWISSGSASAPHRNSLPQNILLPSAARAANIESIFSAR